MSMVKPEIPTVMLVAGLAATGKSTLLKQAVETRNFDLFGAKYSPYFKKVRIPQSFPEDNLRLRERLEQGTWLHESDLVRIRGRTIPFKSAVIHLELFWWIYINLLTHLSLSETEREMRSLLLDENKIYAYFKNMMMVSPLAPADLVVKVLKPEYAVTLERFIARESKLKRIDHNPGLQLSRDIIFNGRPDGYAVYTSIYSAWHRVLTELQIRCVVSCPSEEANLAEAYET